jgi:hypothetical protein
MEEFRSSGEAWLRRWDGLPARFARCPPSLRQLPLTAMDRFRRYIATCPAAERTFFQGILESWDQAKLERAHDLAAAVEESGCQEPEGWVLSEISEDIPQSARFALLQALWDRAISPAVRGCFWLDKGKCADVFRKIEGALSPEERHALFVEIAKALTFQIMNTIDEGSYNDKLPGWMVSEVDSSGATTGRELSGLHESVLDEALSRRDT